LQLTSKYRRAKRENRGCLASTNEAVALGNPATVILKHRRLALGCYLAQQQWPVINGGETCWRGLSSVKCAKRK